MSRARARRMCVRFMRSTPLLVAAGLASALVVSTASAGDRCEGTLCDLYYDHMGAPPPAATPAQPATKAAPTPITVPSNGLLGHLFSGGASSQQPATPGAAPPHKPLVAVQGGGVVGLMQGAAPDRCTGTLCDFYYGGPPPEAPDAAIQEPGAPSVEPAADDAPEPQPPRRRGAHRRGAGRTAMRHRRARPVALLPPLTFRDRCARSTGDPRQNSISSSSISSGSARAAASHSCISGMSRSRSQ